MAPRLAWVQSPTTSIAPRPRDFVRVAGPQAAAFLQRMISNDVEALVEGASCEALLLTAKGRVIAPLRVWRRGADDFLLLTEPQLGDAVAACLLKMRVTTRCEIEREEHVSTLVLGAGAGVGGIANDDYGVPAVEVLDVAVDGTPVEEEELERLRILALTPRFGREIDERVLPAEAGLDRRAVSFSKGCYPGQEPVARLRFRGKPNRTLRLLELEGEPPAYDAEIVHAGKAVGRVTSAVAGVALGFVRVGVPDDAELAVEGRPARLLA
jgi:tRNA-modifying protein YgfZ